MRNSIAKGIAAIFVAGVLAAGVCCAGFAARDENGKWFGNSDLTTWHWKDKTDDKTPDDTTEGRDLVNVLEESGVSLMSVSIPVSDYAANGIAESAENAYTLTATVLPLTADNKEVDWTVSWVNGSSEWASGKTVTDYVTVTPTSDGASTANVVCSQAFGEQIHVRCVSRDNTDAYAICSVDFEKKVVGVNVKLFSQLEAGSAYCTLKSSEMANKQPVPSNMGYCYIDRFDFEYSAYTVDKSYGGAKISLSANEEWAEVLRNNGIECSPVVDNVFTPVTPVGDHSTDSNRKSFQVNRSVFSAWEGSQNLYGLTTSDFNNALSAIRTSGVYERFPCLTLSFSDGWSGSLSFKIDIPIYCSADAFIINVSDVVVDDNIIF